MKTRNLLIRLTYEEHQAALAWLGDAISDPKADRAGQVLLDRLKAVRDAGDTFGVELREESEAITSGDSETSETGGEGASPDPEPEKTTKAPGGVSIRK